MDFEERERKERQHMIKVVLAETGMVLAVVAIVAVAVMASMGFFVASDGKIEQTGLAQIHSTPTGASVELDGTTLFSRTNLSKTVPDGEHTLKLTRANYDTWENTIRVRSGLLLRLYYPRLFLLNRTAEKSAKLGEDLAFFVPSSDRTSVVYAEKSSPYWQILSLDGDEVRQTKLDLTTILTTTEDDKFNGDIEELEWSKNGDYVLVRVAYETQREWILVNLKDTKRSLNLTKNFGLDFARVEMIDNSASKLFVLENQHIRRVNTADGTISQVLLEGVEDFDSEGTNLVYVQKIRDDQETQRVIGSYHDGERGGVTLTKVEDGARVKVALARYYDEDYLAYFMDDKLSVYYGTMPSYREDIETGDNTELDSMQALLNDENFALIPESFYPSPEDDYLIATSGRHYMVVGLDAGEIYEYDVKTKQVNWLAASMMSEVADGALRVWDYDFANQRELVTNYDTEERAEVTTYVKQTLLDYPAVITNNGKWLYYVVQDANNATLMRERIRE